jgi:hypothetical protein
MVGKTNLTILVGLGILFLAGVLVVQQSEFGGNFFVVRGRINVKEAFNGNGPAEGKEAVLGVLEMTATGPADANIANQRKPYNLLNGVLPDDEKNRLSGLSAQGCYEGNFATRLQRSSHRQLTNNYKRYNPDSCSAPFTELVTSFYKVEPLART